MLMMKKIYQPKAKDSEIKPNTLPLRSISTDLTVYNIKKNELKEYIFLDYNTNRASNIVDIHK